ncbi:TonB-dependent receptor plug domain-containing protein [Anaerosinus massiliensis]|uniref:TonB-dependent receptor plug domain-containing protein n=1 Tax=Massilibacillus massiliensis TaxID=1806837 RepID=UPI000ADA6470|nr:TonB-dependent receptor [Massilibacillus massiliensis]
MYKGCKRRYILRTMICTALLLSTSYIGQANANVQEEEEFDTVVVTANRIPTQLSETAANVTVITAKEIADRHYGDVAEALRQVDGVVITEASMTRQDIVRIDGDDRVVVMVDGRRVNLDKGAATGRAGIDLKTIAGMQNIERIEVVKGAGSVLYGSDAVGGVINIITKKGQSGISSTLDVSAGSWNTHKVDLTTQGSDHDWSWFVSAGKQNQDYMKYKNYKNNATEKMDNSDYSKENATFRLDKILDQGTSLTLQFEHMTDESGQWNQAPGYRGYGGLSNHYLHDRMDKLVNNWAFTYNYKEDTDLPSHIRYYSNYTTQGFDDVDGSGGYSKYANKMKGIEWQEGWQADVNNTIVTGAEWRETKIDNGAVHGGNYENKKLENKAFYFQDTMRISDKVSLVSGVRYDDHSKFGGKTTSKAALNYKVNNISSFYISWGQIFNAPNADDLYWYDPSYFMYGNPNLKPETGDKTTVGFHTKLNEQTSFNASVFKSEIKNAIGWVYNDMTYITMPQNANRQTKKGIELSVNHQINENWKLDAGYSYIKTETKIGDDAYQWDEKNSRPNGYRFGISYHDEKWSNMLTGSAGTGRSSKYYTANYWIWDANVNYKMNQMMTAYLKMNNITNRAYELTGNDPVGAYPMAGRSFQVGVKYAF